MFSADPVGWRAADEHGLGVERRLKSRNKSEVSFTKLYLPHGRACPTTPLRNKGTTQYTIVWIGVDWLLEKRHLVWKHDSLS